MWRNVNEFGDMTKCGYILYVKTTAWGGDKEKEGWRENWDSNNTVQWLYNSPLLVIHQLQLQLCSNSKLTMTDRQQWRCKVRTQLTEKTEKHTRQKLHDFFFFFFTIFTTVLSQWDFSHQKFRVPSLGKASCNRVVLPNLECMLGVFVFQ